MIFQDLGYSWITLYITGMRWLIASLLAVILTIIHFGLSLTDFGNRIEFNALDLWFNVRGKLQAPNQIALVAIDEVSYNSLDIPLNRPWPRALHARLLDKLKEAGAKRVVFDVLFFDRDPLPEVDQQLAESLRKIPTIVGGDILEQTQLAGNLAVNMRMVKQPVDAVKNNVASVGLVSTLEDFGYVRRFFSTPSEFSEEFYPLSALAAFGEAPPYYPGQGDLINFYGPSGTIRTYSYERIIQEPTERIASQLKDKIVFVGLKLKTEFGAAQKDAYFVPFLSEGRMFGVEVHATAAGNLLEKNWIVRAPRSLELAVLSILSLATSFLLFVLRPHIAGILFIAFSLTWVLVSYLSFTSNIFVPGTLLMTFVWPASFIASTLYYYFTTRRSQLQTKRAFEHYLSPEMAEEIAKNPKATVLGGYGAYATIMFTDIEGFTSITEKMLPEQVAEMLNAYFTEAVEVIFPSKGTLIKFIGDAVFAIWNAPLKVQDHAKRACETALQIQEGVKRFNDSARFPHLKTRIGIHTGTLVVGNLGSARRFDFTAIGDSVNLASRIESANKFFGTGILITSDTKRELKDALITVPMGRILVAGKDSAVEVFTILSQPLSPAVLGIWERALRDFRSCRWNEAEAGFKELSSNKDFGVATQNYLRIIQEFRLSPPEEKWEGEIGLKSK